MHELLATKQNIIQNYTPPTLTRSHHPYHKNTLIISIKKPSNVRYSRLRDCATRGIRSFTRRTGHSVIFADTNLPTAVSAQGFNTSQVTHIILIVQSGIKMQNPIIVAESQ